MASQADQFNAELVGSGSLVDREYLRLLTKTGQPAGRYSLRDLYELASEEPRLILGEYASVGPPPYIFTDDFNRADGDLGAEWIQIVEPMTIVSNTAQSGGTQKGHVRHTSPMDGDDHYAQAVINGPIDGGVFVRGNASTSSATFDGYFARYDNTTSNWSIYKFVGGAATVLASLTSSATFPFTLRLEVEGSNLRCYKDGVQILTATNADLPSGLYVGTRVFNTFQSIDNFEASIL